MQSSIRPIKIPPDFKLNPIGYAHARITDYIMEIFCTLLYDNPNTSYENEALESQIRSRKSLTQEVIAIDRGRRRIEEAEAMQLDQYYFGMLPSERRKVDRKINSAMKKIAPQRWSGEFLRLAIYFVYLMDLVEYKSHKDALEFVEKFRSSLEAFFSEFGDVRKKYSRKHGAMIRRKATDDQRAKDRKRIVGLAIDEILRNPKMKINTAINNAWIFWMKKSRTMQSFDEKKYGQNPKRNNLKRRYFKTGVSKEKIFKNFMTEVGDSFDEFLALRDQLPKDYEDSCVSLPSAEKLYLLVEKKLEDKKSKSHIMTTTRGLSRGTSRHAKA